MSPRRGLMPKFAATWEVLINDACDDPESVHPMPDVDVEAGTLCEAKEKFEAVAHTKIAETWPDRTGGTFIARLLTLTDEQGKTKVIHGPMKLDSFTFVPASSGC
jgi:hypothetical protein